MSYEMDNETYYWEDLQIFLCFAGIILGMIMTVLGAFIPHESSYFWEYYMALGLPLWIFSTVSITKSLTFESRRDIKEALTDYSR